MERQGPWEQSGLGTCSRRAGSVLTMAGVPQRTIMAILGHRDPRMTVRYQHLAPGHLRDAMQALDAPTTAPSAAAGSVNATSSGTS